MFTVLKFENFESNYQNLFLKSDLECIFLIFIEIIPSGLCVYLNISILLYHSGLLFTSIFNKTYLSIKIKKKTIHVSTFTL